MKSEIATLLRNQPRRILVIIDDIDRLTSEEIRQVFRAVKSVGDFPNVTYLMAFDKRVVARSLGEIQGGSGEDYLEKIVQVPFELPLVDRASIQRLFFEQTDVILAEIDPKSFDQTYWGNIFFQGIDKFLETPRDLIRLTNVLAVTFRAVTGEVNPVDFIAIESLRIFCPEVYDAIKNNRAMFTSPDTARLREESAQFHESWLARLRETSPHLVQPVKDMVERLFPKLKGVWGNTHFGGDWEVEWRLKLRVCSDSVFPIYFSLAIQTGEISNRDIQAILARAINAEQFGGEILKLAEQFRPDGKTKASAFLVRLQDYTASEINVEQIQPIVEALLNVGDQLMQLDETDSGLFDLGVDVQSGRVIWQLVKRLEAPRRFEILKHAFETGLALYLMQTSFIVLAQQQRIVRRTLTPGARMVRNPGAAFGPRESSGGENTPWSPGWLTLKDTPVGAGPELLVRKGRTRGSTELDSRYREGRPSVGGIPRKMPSD